MHEMIMPQVLPNLSPISPVQCIAGTKTFYAGISLSQCYFLGPCNLSIRKHGYKIKVLSEVESKVEKPKVENLQNAYR